MKKLLVLASVILLTSCTQCDTSQCKFKQGDDVHIKNKWKHNDAVVTKVICGCEYEIGYFSSFGIRRHRTVTGGEIEMND